MFIELLWKVGEVLSLSFLLCGGATVLIESLPQLTAGRVLKWTQPFLRHLGFSQTFNKRERT
jgi:hypothetical protein